MRLSMRPARPRPRLESVSVIFVSCRAAGADASLSTSGVPLSPPSRRRTSSGTWPSSGTEVPVILVRVSAVRAHHVRHVLDHAHDALPGLRDQGPGTLGDL